MRVIVGVDVHPSIEEQNDEAESVRLYLELIALTQPDMPGIAAHDDGSALANSTTARRSSATLITPVIPAAYKLCILRVTEKRFECEGESNKKVL